MDNALERYLFSRADALETPLKATLELTPLCNMNCGMCYIRHTPAQVREKGGLLPLSFWQSLIPQLKDAGTLFTALIGGEIFTLPWLEELYCQLHGSGFYVNFTTNAVLFADGVPGWLAERPPRYATVSIYGASDETYRKLTGDPDGYSRMARGVDNLTAAGIPVKFNFTVLPENTAETEEVLRFAESRELPLLSTAYSFPPGTRNSGKGYRRMGPEEAAAAELRLRERTMAGEKFHLWLDSLLHPETMERERYRHFTCRAGVSSVWISWQGRAAACGMMDAPSADLKDRPFDQAWRELKELTAALEISAECAACPQRGACSVCPAMIYTETGSFQSVPDYVCRYTRELIRLAGKRMDMTIKGDTTDKC